MAEIYFKNHCSSCNGGIEFPAYLVGEQISCPHCQQELTLLFPSDKSNEATKLVENYLQSSPFPTHPAELSLLKQFAYFPADIISLRGLDIWRTALGAEPTDVICRFSEVGFLQDGCNDLVALLQTKSANDLKALAESRGLGKSGTKETLAKRLFKGDPEGMRTLFLGKSFFVCTPKGRLIVEKYLESEAEIKKQCEHEVITALEDHRWKDACLRVASFEASRVFPRGVGMDWKNYNSNYDLSVLKQISECRLQRHVFFDENVVSKLRVSAAEMHLWGTNKPSALGLNIDFDWAVESRMILFSALGAIRLQEMRAAGINRVKILGCGSPDVCSVCKSANDKVYRIDNAPTLPHENCTCENGCCCLLTANE
jgi:hypothetical protein